MTQSTQAVLNALLHIELLASTPEGLEELNRPSLGICSTMLDVLRLQLGRNTPEHDEAYDLWNSTYRQLFMDWPEYSGHEAYPIRVASYPHPTDEGEFLDTSSEQFNNSVTMYGLDSYGEARLRLVSYLIDNFRMALTSYQVICDRSNNP